ncbi:hypothetical protein ACFLYA_00135 [Candidatus Dependentiae bacterium]
MINSKSVLTAFCVGSLFFSSAYAEIAYPTKENIEKRRAAIERDLTSGKLIDGSIVGAVLLSAGILTYKLLKTKEQEPKKVKYLRSKTIKKILEIEKKTDPKLFSKIWFKSLGKSVFHGVASSILGALGVKVLESFYKRYHCFGNLETFVDVRFSGMQCFDEIIYNAQLHDAFLHESDQMLKIAKDSFIVSLRNLVATVEDIVAFIEYKIDSFEGVKLSQEDILISSHIFECTNTYCSEVEALLSRDAQEELLMATANFRVQVERFIESFKGLEKRVAWMR